MFTVLAGDSETEFRFSEDVGPELITAAFIIEHRQYRARVLASLKKTVSTQKHSVTLNQVPSNYEQLAK